ncbi:MAG: hypothetical protein Q4C66_05225 [Lachnospiraceae bacterium]|nr:hypothetical protein [Lachnospiraceae bacterium]
MKNISLKRDFEKESKNWLEITMNWYLHTKTAEKWLRSGTVCAGQSHLEENYRQIEGLNLLMFLMKHTTYQKEVEDHLIREKIFLENLEPFIDKYPKSILKVFSKLFR